MAKPSAGFHTPRPTSLRSASAARSSVGSSSSAPKLPAPTAIPRDLSSHAKRVVAKCLAYDDNFTFPAAASTLPPEGVPEGLAAPEDDLATLLELPDPDPDVAGDASSSTVISAAPDDAVVASADSGLTEVAAPTDSTADSEEPLPEYIELVLAELQGADGLSPRSKRLIAALAEVAAAELTPTATSRRLRRAAFWGKVRVGILAATVAAVAAIDIALAVALIGRGRNDHYHTLPPT